MQVKVLSTLARGEGSREDSSGSKKSLIFFTYSYSMVPDKILKITVHWDKASNPSLTGEYNGCQTAIQRWEEGAGMKRC
jgi:hypothetical protein